MPPAILSNGYTFAHIDMPGLVSIIIISAHGWNVIRDMYQFPTDRDSYLYFAYGSNMNPEQMQKRVGETHFQ